MDQEFYNAVTRNPVIAAIKDYDGLEHCLVTEEFQMVFILFGNICNIGDIVHRVKAAGKFVLVHADLIEGLSSKEIAVDYLKQNTETNGIITTRQNFIRRARELRMCSILRIFVIDSMALSGVGNLESVRPDFIEILPGILPKIIRRICSITSIPILAGGLIQSKEDVISALEAGAMAISTTNQSVWLM